MRRKALSRERKASLQTRVARKLDQAVGFCFGSNFAIPMRTPGLPRHPAEQSTVHFQGSHQHRSDGEHPCPRLFGERPQIAAGRVDMLGPLQNTGDDDGGGFIPITSQASS